MNKYSDFEVQKVREADIRLFVRGANEGKAKTEMDCPFCGAKKKFTVLHRGKYNYAKCWVCNEGFSGPLEAYAYLQGLDIKRDYVKCIEGVASMAGIPITPEETVRKKKVKEEKAKVQKTFTHQQLDGSGLAVEDLMATVMEKGQELTMCPFQPGTIKNGQPVVRQGDDMLIFYYDLYGNPVQYGKTGAA